MPIRDTWHRTLVYFGLAEDEGYEDDEYDALPEAEPVADDSYRDRPNVRRLSSSRRRRDEFDDIFADDAPADRRPTTALRPVAPAAPAATVATSGSTSSHRGASTMFRTSPTSSSKRFR